MSHDTDPTILALLTKDIETLITTLQEKTTESLAGEGVNIAGYDEKITKLCETVQALPGKEAQSFEPLLKKMIITLDQLARAIQNNIKHADT